MPVLSTIVQKGGDCKSKVLPPCVLDIVGQNSRGTNNVFEYKQLLRFLENKMVGRSSRQSYKMSKLFPWSEALSRWVTPKKLRSYEAKLIEGNEEDDARLSSFCVVLFLFFES